MVEMGDVVASGVNKAEVVGRPTYGVLDNNDAGRACGATGVVNSGAGRVRAPHLL